MELRKESVQMLQIKSRAASQVTFDTDYNVPDAKPDVGRLIQNKGDRNSHRDISGGSLVGMKSL